MKTRRLLILTLVSICAIYGADAKMNVFNGVEYMVISINLPGETQNYIKESDLAFIGEKFSKTKIRLIKNEDIGKDNMAKGIGIVIDIRTYKTKDDALIVLFPQFFVQTIAALPPGGIAIGDFEIRSAHIIDGKTSESIKEGLLHFYEKWSSEYVEIIRASK